jgi:predicted transcriptional regulator
MGRKPGVVVQEALAALSRVTPGSGVDRGVATAEGLEVFRPEALPMGPAPLEAWDHPSVRALVGLKRDERVAVAAALRAVGASTAAIAQALGLSVDTVSTYLAAAREWGALRDVVRDIECRLVPKAVENLAALLEQGDKQATLEVLKGRGLLRKHTAGQKEGSSGPPDLRLTVVFAGAPAGAADRVGVALASGSGGEVVGVATAEPVATVLETVEAEPPAGPAEG